MTSDNDHPEVALPVSTMVCRTCGEPLTRFHNRENPTPVWSHRSLSVTHPPDPVPGVETNTVNLVCDFCSAPAPRWAFPVDPREIREKVGEGTITFNNDGWWTACDACADLIDAADRTGLTKHATTRLRKHSMAHRRLPAALAHRAVDEGHAMFWSRKAGGRYALSSPRRH